MRSKGPLDFFQNEIQNVGIEKLADDPTGGDLFEGRIWLNTTSDRLKIYVNGEVTNIAIGSGVIDDLQTEIDTTQAAVGLDTDGSLISPSGTNYIDAATSVVDMSELLDTQVKANEDAIDTEVLARGSADTTIQTEIDNIETGAGLNTDGTFTASVGYDYISSATSLKNADELLDGAAAALQSSKVDLDGDTMTGDLGMGANKITSTYVPASDEDLTNKLFVDSSISSKTYLYVAGSALVTHNINHGLGSQYPSLTVWDVADDEQIIPLSVTATDADNLSVVLSVATQINVKIMS